MRLAQARANPNPSPTPSPKPRPEPRTPGAGARQPEPEPYLPPRLAQAHARLMWRDRVEQMDAVTAVLLMESSMGKMFGEISVLKVSERRPR